MNAAVRSIAVGRTRPLHCAYSVQWAKPPALEPAVNGVNETFKHLRNMRHFREILTSDELAPFVLAIDALGKFHAIFGF